MNNKNENNEVNEKNKLMKSKRLKAKKLTHDKRVALLTSTATALLQTHPIVSQGAETNNPTNIQYHHTEYSESNDRMSVTADQVTFDTIWSEAWQTNFTAIRDITTGASPVVNLLDIDGNPQQVLQTGASIRDERKIFEVSADHTGDRQSEGTWLEQGNWGFKLGHSSEDDYLSRYGNIYYALDLNQKRTQVLFSTGYSKDDVWNSYNPDVLLEAPTVRNKRKKQEWMLSISQVLNRFTFIEAKLTHVKQKGALSDPYKKTMVVDEGVIDYRGLIDVAGFLTLLTDAGLIDFLNESGITRVLNESDLINVPQISEFALGLFPDSRPSNRNQWIVSLRTSRHLPTLDSSIHLDYRYANDSWEADSHTFEFTWNWEIENWIVSPSIRYYSQANAFFYAPFFETVPDHGSVSSDYRLAGFGALSYKLGLHRDFGERITLSANVESYTRRYDWQLGDPFHSSQDRIGDSLDDFEFDLLSVGIDVLF